MDKKYLQWFFFLWVFSIVFYIFFGHFFFGGAEKQSRAAGENSVVVYFNNALISGVKGAVFSPIIQANAGVDMVIRGYNFDVSFDKTKLQVTSIIYKFGTNDADGDTNSTLVQVNQAGRINIIGKTPIDGLILYSNKANDIVQITFKVLTAPAATPISIITTGGRFYKKGVDAISLTTLPINVAFELMVNQPANQPFQLTVCPAGATEGVNGCNFAGGDGIQQAINVAPSGKTASMSAIFIKAGSYERKNFNSIVTSSSYKRRYFLTTLSKNMTIVGEGSKNTIVKGTNNIVKERHDNEISGIYVPAGMVDIKKIGFSDFKMSDNFKFNVNTTYESEGNALLVERTAQVNVIGCIFKNMDHQAISLANTATLTLKNNLIFDNYINPATDTGRIIATSGGGGVHVEYSNNNLKLFNNVFYNNKHSGIKINRTSTGYTPKIEAKNNIFVGNKKFVNGQGGYGFEYVGAEVNNIILYNNAFYNNEAGCAIDLFHCIKNNSLNNLDPKFVDMSAYDFHLKNTANDKSPLINKGDPKIKNPDGSISDIGAYGGPDACELDSSISGCASCIPKPPCVDGIIDPKTGAKIYCDPKPGTIFCTPTPTSPITFPYCNIRSEPIIKCPTGYICKNTCNPSPGMEGCAQYDVCVPISTSSAFLNLKLKFQGITKKPADGFNLIRVRVKIAGQSLDDSDEQTIDFKSDESGIWQPTASISFSEKIVAGDGYTVFIKGEKHIQKKICDAKPTETSPGSHHCSSGKITLVDGVNNLDFSGILQMAGDLPAQDGIVNSYDLTLVRNNLGKTDADALKMADINKDGIVNIQDYSLIIFALSTRFDEE